MKNYKPWKLFVLLPFIILLETAHCLCECAKAFDRGILEPLGDLMEEWVND